MDLAVFGLLLGLGLVFVIVGAFRPQETYYGVMGFSLFIFLGAFLMSFNSWEVTHITGEEVTTNYTISGNITTSAATTTTYTAEPLENLGLTGFLLFLFGALGLIITFMQLKTGGPNGDT